MPSNTALHQPVEIDNLSETEISNILEDDDAFDLMLELLDEESGDKSSFDFENNQTNEKEKKESEDDDIFPDFYQQYYRSIPILTKEEEYALGVKLKEGTEEEKKEARNMLVEHNLRYVLKLSRRYVGHGISIDDIIQFGAFGLIKATQKYDYELGYRFTTYATHWIRQSIVRGIQNHGRAIYLPAYLYCEYSKVKKADALVAGKYKDEKDHIRKISEISGLDEDMIRHLREVMSPLTSLDLPIRANEIDPDSSTLMDYVQNGGPSVEEIVEKEMLKEPVACIIRERLNEQEHDVIVKRFGLDGGEPQTLSQIGAAKKLSRERIRQIEERALSKLRRSGFGAKFKDYLH